jgi:hypothetical protein
MCYPIYMVCLNSLVNGTRKQTKQKIQIKLVYLYCFVCFLVPFTEMFRHTTYVIRHNCGI